MGVHLLQKQYMCSKSLLKRLYVSDPRLSLIWYGSAIYWAVLAPKCFSLASVSLNLGYILKTSSRDVMFSKVINNAACGPPVPNQPMYPQNHDRPLCVKTRSWSSLLRWCPMTKKANNLTQCSSPSVCSPQYGIYLKRKLKKHCVLPKFTKYHYMCVLLLQN